MQTFPLALRPVRSPRAARQATRLLTAGRAAAVWRAHAVAIAACLAAPAPAARAQAARPPIVITGVSVIPMDREAVIANQTVIIEDGRIAYVGAGRAAPAGAITVDGRGKFLIPGIAEFHAHVPPPTQASVVHQTLALYALNGVTTARGMLGLPLHLALRDSIARRQLLGPRLLTSGPSFSGGTVSSPAAAAQMVRTQKAAGYDLLKIHPGVSREAFDSLAAVANSVGIPFAGHVPIEIGLDRALTGKYSTIDHLDGIAEAMLPPGAPLTVAQGGLFGFNLTPHLDRSRLPAIVQRVKAAGVAMVPTQTLMENYASDETGEAITARPEMKYWVPAQVTQWRNNKNNVLATSPLTPAQRAQYVALRRDVLRSLHQAGVVILLGSDAPQLWNVPGFSAHRELETYVWAGLTPYEALRTGTVNVAAFLGEAGRSGVVREGARGDLLLLDANPLQDITNTLRIAGVVVDGRWISGEERARQLAAMVAQ